MSRGTRLCAPRRSAPRGAALAFAVAGSALLLAGCGQKGPLYLPDPAPQAVPPLPGSATAPASNSSEHDNKKQPASTPTP